MARDPAPAAAQNPTSATALESARRAELANGGVPAPGLAEISPRNVPDVPKGETSGAMVVPSSPVPDKPEDQVASSPVSGAAGSPRMPMQAFMVGDGADQRQQRGRGDAESLGGIAEVVAPTARGPAVEVQAVPLSPRPGAAEPPATPVHVSRQLAEAAGAQRDGMVEVALAPEELGKVKLRLQAHDGVMSVSIQAERPETLDLMRRHADLLARDFRDLGFRDVAFSFAEHSGQRPAPPPDPDEGMELAPTIDPARPLPIPPKPSAAGRGLDLRM
ncbi:flagellar hook-length control protein FliK [Sedimentimonas flavescens]|uniref:flagellar hook-length control protein FliK n=1 Tax=Sedimentimonas flavescens TaxID=2851012 RepID=UPI0021A324F2|nr:flagellar hook-length control protein FliK [Sedimentimonas flavescens]MCT2539792.1 flagellar hook-length control protein FliK [Sedimentimonas flavescens]